MPYVSAKQRAYMHIHLPKIARRWDREYGGAVKKQPNRRAIKRALDRRQGNAR